MRHEICRVARWKGEDLRLSDTVLVTGGAGFIGSNFVLDWIRSESGKILTFDKLTYAGNVQNLASVASSPQHAFTPGDICDADSLVEVFVSHRPRAVVHFAAETHVDRSINNPEEFVRTNVQGTLCLLRKAYEFWKDLAAEDRAQFRFLHISTDEVYGSLAPNEPPFSETSRYAPNSPYAASKAASDHLVRAYQHTYGMPTLTTNCSNNYGPFQFPEKLIPLVILNAFERKPLPIYGDGLNVRDWLYVRDHCAAIRCVLKHGRPGETYNVGGDGERTNIDVVTTICDILDELHPDAPIGSRRSLIQYVKDRPGHDRRYAINTRKIHEELGWSPQTAFQEGIRQTISWYLENMDWVAQVRSGQYQEWMQLNYKGR
jgi:dTDP-glucose 4,6-dehydratase